MNITVEQAQGVFPIILITPQGDLDASNYQNLIALATQAFRDGSRYLLLDMSSIPYMSSSGIVALHNITMLFNGDQAPDPEAGWDAIYAVESLDSSQAQEHVKLLSPSPRVIRTLEKTGLITFFHIFTEREQALASFGGS